MNLLVPLTVLALASTAIKPKLAAKAAPDAGLPGDAAPSREQMQRFIAQQQKGPPAIYHRPAGVPRIGVESLRARVPIYPNASEPAAAVGDQLESYGMPTNVLAFTTPDSPRQVLDYYRGVFTEWHLPMLGDGDMFRRMPYPSITVFDQEDDVEVSAVAIPTEGKGSTVLLVLADVKGFYANLQRDQAQEYGGLPPYPGGKQPNAVTSTDGEHQTRTVVFSTADKPEQVIAFYLQALTAAGWTRLPDPAGDDQSLKLLDFGRGAERWHLAVIPATGAPGTNVSATWQSAEQVPPNLDEGKP